MKEPSESGAKSEDSRGDEVIADRDNSDAASDLSDEQPQRETSTGEQLPAANPDFDVKVHDDISQQKSNDEEDGKSQPLDKASREKENGAAAEPNAEKGKKTGKVRRRRRQGNRDRILLSRSFGSAADTGRRITCGWSSGRSRRTIRR